MSLPIIQQVEIKKLLKRRTAAQEALLHRMEQIFPKGSKWEVSIGDRPPILAMVIGHGSSWYEPEIVRLQNLNTECERRASATDMLNATLVERLS